MTDQEHSLNEKLDEALRSLDDRTRSLRAERILWLSQHERLPPVLMGRAETLHLLREAREVFVNGHFAATLVLAVAVIEHSLVEELQLRGSIKTSPPLGKVLAIAEEAKVLPSEWFSPIRTLVQRRNPFAHLKEPDHEHALGVRIVLEGEHPSRLLEEDAKVAAIWMYKVFRATLREVA